MVQATTRTFLLPPFTVSSALALSCAGCVLPLRHAADHSSFSTDAALDTVSTPQWVGCYQVAFPWWPEFPGDRMRLDTTAADTTPSDPRYHPASPEVGRYLKPSWMVAGPDWIQVVWPEVHHAVVLRLRLAGDSLVGDFLSGAGLGTPWGPRFPRRPIVAYRLDCAATSRSRPPPPVGNTTYDVWSTIGGRVGAPQKLAADIAFVRMPGGATVSFEPGLGGGQIGLGVSAISPFNAARLQGILLHTWGDPWKLAPRQTFFGLEARVTGAGIGLGLALYSRVHGSVPGDSWLLAPSFVLGF